MVNLGRRPTAAASTPAVSVVVPTFNARAFLEETLDAALGQTGVALEVIVVDDGSTDDTATLVRARYPQVTLIVQDNAGVSVARNRGLARARGRFVCFLDQDDVWLPSTLARLADCLDEHPELAAVACPYRFWHPQPSGTYLLPAIDPAPDGPRFVPGFERWTYHHFLSDCWALTSATMLRTEVVRRLGGFDTALSYSEDWDLWLRISREAGFAQLSWPPVLYRQHGEQGSRAVRAIDYRSALLQRAALRYGLTGPDGTAIGRRQFRHRIAAFRAEFGYHHAQHGDRLRAVQALMHAWVLHPQCARRLLLACATALGWRPR